ncbi:MAG: formylglycine-generating enzyme family protein [Candidatus Wallbacteria bacterium]|nr:formylglycine-generating enzyme family protein [Candidatus Wallbacteria bacterium]
MIARLVVPFLVVILCGCGGGAKALKTMTVNIGSPIELVWIPPGEFMMGSPLGEIGQEECEQPQHKVVISKGFWLGKYEVTQEQWQNVTLHNPCQTKNNKLPVHNVSWRECRDFILHLNERKRGYFRLPTEAEWEYACRAGSDTGYYWGELMKDEYCWNSGNSSKRTQQVGKKKPNNWGLYDMSGNALEWVEDFFNDKFYEKSPEIDPFSRENSGMVCARGGSWMSSDSQLRSSARHRYASTHKDEFIGFRLLMQAD